MRNLELADWYVASYQGGIVRNLILATDGKISDIEVATRASLYHCQNCLVFENPLKTWPIMLIGKK